MSLHIRDGGTWKDIEQLHVKDGGAIKEVETAYVRHNGQWKEFFASEVVLTDDGSASSPGAGTTHTYPNQVSAGPVSVLLASWRNNLTNRTLVSATWNDDPVAILDQDLSDIGESIGAAILLIVGAQSGDLVLTFSGYVQESRITRVSLKNVRSVTPVDTDTDAFDGSAHPVLDTLTVPGSGGIVLAVFSGEADTTAIDWINIGAELDDADVGNHRHAAAYVIGNPSDDIEAQGSTSTRNKVLVGVALR